MGRLCVLLLVLSLVGCAHRARSWLELEAMVQSNSRPETDRALDEERRPVQLLTFAQVGRDMQVGELVAGAGYTTELLALAVGPLGLVYGQNPREVLEGRRVGHAWDERVKRLPNVLRVDRELGDPFPADLTGALDLVISNASYHDTAWLGTDRARMNRGVFRALKSGGLYVVCDSTAGEGRGDADALTLHRIEDATVKREVLSAGFELDGDAGYLRNPSPNRDWNGSPIGRAEKPDERDRFCLRFRRP